MPRPVKHRFVEGPPPSDYFKPRGVPLAGLEVAVLTMDEFEALRLADHEGLYQEEAAQRMGISRQTFGKIVESGRKKIAGALVNSRAIRIEGGVYRTPRRGFLSCPECGYRWPAGVPAGAPANCPSCGTAVPPPVPETPPSGRSGSFRGRGRGRGRRGADLA